MAWLHSVVVSVLVFIGSLFGFNSAPARVSPSSAPSEVRIAQSEPAKTGTEPSGNKKSPPGAVDFPFITEILKPQFVDDDESDLLDQTRDQLIARARSILIVNDPDGAAFYSELLLVGVGPCYVLLTRFTSHNAEDIIVDLVAATSTSLIYGYSFKFATSSIAYILDDDILTYTLNTGSFVELPGAKIGKDETYNAAEGPFMDITEKHTDRSIMIRVYDLQGRPVRDVNLDLPR